MQATAKLARTPVGIIGLVGLASLAAPTALAAHDWPQFLGPTRDGVYRGGGLAEKWPEGGPKRLWEMDVGAGFSAPVVAGGRLVVFHRRGDRETIDCLDAESGKALWRSDHPTAYIDDFGFDPGPRATPAIAAGRIFAFGAEGILSAFDLESGAPLWSVRAAERFGARKGYFGAACSPLVEDGKVLLNVGGKGTAGIAAFEAESGKVVWTATDHEASYSSPVAATAGGERRVFFFTRQGLVDLDPASGKVRSMRRWRARIDASVNAATPIVAGDLVFITSSYDTGAALLRLADPEPELVWSGDESLSCHYATPVLRDGFLYGFHGRQEYGPSLRAVELRTGKVAWEKAGLGAGTVTLAGDRLLVLTEKGELIAAPAASAGFEPGARASILTGTVRAYPALAHGLLYARNENKLVCVDLRMRSPKEK